MSPVPKIVGPFRAIKLFGVTLVGVSAENLRKLLLTLLFAVVVVLLSKALRALAGWISRKVRNPRFQFWNRQVIHLVTAVLLVVGLLSIWFDNPGRLATVVGLVTAGLAFALQKVVTSFAGYLVILRGRTFNVGDRITMGGVRGDVIALGFIQTTIMEMGQPPEVQDADPAMWVRARQYTGRIVTVTNDKIFETPVYNYTRQFPFIWEEIKIPITYDADAELAERILLEVVGRYTLDIKEISEGDRKELERRYVMRLTELGPRVYFRITSNWLELSVRFLARDHEIRELKDRISRDLVKSFRRVRIGIASTTYEIVGLPPLRIQEWPQERPGEPGPRKTG